MDRMIYLSMSGAKALMQRIVAEKEWAAFGTIAAEADLARLD